MEGKTLSNSQINMVYLINVVWFLLLYVHEITFCNFTIPYIFGGKTGLSFSISVCPR